MQIQTIAHRTSLNSLVFPIDVLLTIVCEYALAKQQDASIGADPAWPVLLFLQLRVSPAMIVRVLERILDTQEVPFTGRRRKAVVEWINAVVAVWCHELELNGMGSTKGDASMAQWVVDLMGRAERTLLDLLASVRDARLKGELENVSNETRSLREQVSVFIRSAPQSTMRFR